MNQPTIRNSVPPAVNRRKFVQASSLAVAAASALPATLSAGVHHSVDETIRVGLIGCGGRGTAAAANACKADSSVKITALADAFSDRLELCEKRLLANEGTADRLALEEGSRFSGMQCDTDLINSDVDVVLLCQPPFFRPASLKAAVEAGKHVFCEKPVGVDVPGVLSVMETCRNAGNLSIVSGLCWRYDAGVRETVRQIQEGAIGDIVSIQENYLTGELWHRGNRPEWSQLEYQMRNWLYFYWLSGDITAEQHIHSLDKAVWLMGDTPPARAYGVGGRQKRTGKEYGNVYDHFATCFEWPNGVKVFSCCRQMSECFNEVEDWVYGTKGKAQILGNKVVSDGHEWVYDGPKPDMYDVEHEYLFRSIREGKPINNGHYMGISTLVALMARNVCYTGQKLEWEDFLKDETRLGPTQSGFGDFDPGPVPIPGSKL